MKFWDVDVAELLAIETQEEVTGFKYEMFTELLEVKPTPLRVNEAPAGPEVGETVSAPNTSVSGLPKPVTLS